MKNIKMISSLAAIVLAVFVFTAVSMAQNDPIQDRDKIQLKDRLQTQLQNQVQIQPRGFIDLNGDGINDNAIDSDGDGIPNCQDPNYVRPQDGTGNKFKKGNGNVKNGKTWGPGDGTGNDGTGPGDGTGFGSGSGSGTCDGTGPKGHRGGR